MRTVLAMFVLVVAASVVVWAGGGAEAPADTPATGDITFAANGEDFVRQGFTDKHGWHISFDALYVNIVDPTAYAPSAGVSPVVLSGVHWVDLAAGGEDADPLNLGTVQGVRAGNYQSLRFALRRATDGPYAGYSIVMIGAAEKDSVRVPFTVRLDEEMDFDGVEGYVGDELKGLLSAAGSTDVEMTFHFDHVFGDADAPADDHINTGSVGFGMFHAYAADGSVDVDQEQLRDSPGYATLVRALWTLGHLGEGHCEVSGQSSAGTVTEA